MAIGVNIQGPAFKLSPEEATGQPNYYDAIMKGIGGAQSMRESAANLIGKHLANKHAQLELANAPLNRQLLQAKISSALASGQLSKTKADLYSQVLNQPSSNGGQYQNEEGFQYQPGEGGAPYLGMNQQNQVNQSSPMDYKQALTRHLLGLPAELPNEKMQREIGTSNIKEQNKVDIKRAQELRESGKELSLAGVDINGIHDILTGPDSLGTGITKSLIGKAGFGSEKLGEFNERALRLQAQMARALSDRGGQGAANIVASGKPSSWKSTSENLGITNAYAERIKNEFDLLNQEYRNITGKDLPYSLPQYVHNIGRKIDKNMFKPKTNLTTKEEFHAYMESLTPEQRRLATEYYRSKRK